MNEVMGTPTTEDTDYSYIVKSLMKPTGVIQLLKDPRHKNLRARVTREVLKDFKAIVDAKEMLGACDAVGVSREAYSSIFKIFKSSVAQRYKNPAMPLPTPWSLKLARTESNIRAREMVGGYQCVTGTMTWKNQKKAGNQSFEMDSFNNVFVDLEQLQKAMVKFYGQNQNGMLISIMHWIYQGFFIVLHLYHYHFPLPSLVLSFAQIVLASWCSLSKWMKLNWLKNTSLSG